MGAENPRPVSLMDAPEIRTVRGGVTAVQGFWASGICAGIKKGGDLDLALLYSREPCVCAAVMTRNRLQAAPLHLSQQNLKGGMAQAVIVNSGNANACTGAQGMKDAREMARCTARVLGISPALVCVASTGVIGEPLPIKRIRDSIPRGAEQLSRRGGAHAARAIMTTDTRPKTAGLEIPWAKCAVRLGGMAKGSGMVHPDLATLLAFLVTDVRISPLLLRQALREATDQTFNQITIDAETSTNDMVLCMANGMAGNPSLRRGSKELRKFTDALTALCASLARKIVEDGEGATKFIEVRVEGGRDDRQARRIALAVARSALIKSAFYGADPNWGRILAAVGACPDAAHLQSGRLALSYGPIAVVRHGKGLGRAAEARARRYLKRSRISLTLDLGIGSGQSRIWTTDLSPEYVRINASYRT